MVNSIISILYSLDDDTLIKMASFEEGEHLKQFCVLLTLDIQYEKDMEEYDNIWDA
tara:strand:+ start:270 stop:437 length:168 start_codon:yes stop_codon:yes gene_type:complete